VATMPQSKRKMEKQMASDRYIRQRNELNRQAREFLRTILAAGPQPYSVIVARAAEAGISFSTLLTAKQRSIRAPPCGPFRLSSPRNLMPPASQPGAPPLATHPAMAQSRQTTPPTAIGHLLLSWIEPIVVEVVFIDFQGRTHQRGRTGKAGVRDRFQCARSTRSDGLTFVVEKRVVVHSLFRLFHGHLLWNLGPLPHRQPLPAYIVTERYVGIVSAQFVKGDSSR